MPDQLTDRARKAAEEILDYILTKEVSSFDVENITDVAEEIMNRVAAIIERNMREANKENHTHPNDFEPMAFASWRNGND